MRKIFVFTGLFIFICSFCAAQEISSGTVIAAQVKDSGSLKEFNKALFELNEKYESLWGRYVELNKELEGIYTKLEDQKKALMKQNFDKIDPDKIKALETSLGLIRSELSQIREDIGLIKASMNETKLSPRKKWYHGRWIPVTSLGVGLLALIIAL